MLDLVPETETTVRDYATRAGVSIDAFTRRLLSTYAQQQPTTQRWAELEAQPRRILPHLAKPKKKSMRMAISW